MCRYKMTICAPMLCEKYKHEGHARQARKRKKRKNEKVKAKGKGKPQGGHGTAGKSGGLGDDDYENLEDAPMPEGLLEPLEPAPFDHFRSTLFVRFLNTVGEK